MSGLRKIFSFLKREIVLTIAWMLAIFSSFLVHPSKEYIGYIDWILRNPDIDAKTKETCKKYMNYV